MVEIDEIDLHILTLLHGDASLTATELSKLVMLSIPAINKRIAKMISSGVIEKYTVIINPDIVGMRILAFVFLVLDSLESVGTLKEYVKNEGHVLECYAVSGEYDYLLKVRAQSIEDLNTQIMSFKSIKGIVKTRTIIALDVFKQECSVLPRRKKVIKRNIEP